MQPSNDIRRLIEIMAALRDPVAGCPWDVEQTFASIAPFTIEEAYEVADAIERAITRGLARRTRRPPAPGRLSRADGRRSGHVRFRRSGGGDHRQARPPSSPCLRRRRRREPRGGESAVGTHQGGGETGKIRIARNAWVASGASVGRARRRAVGPARADSSDQTARESRQGRFRLERCERGAGENRRGNRRSRGGDRNGFGARRCPARSATSFLRSSTWRAISRSIPRARCAARTPNSSAALRISSIAWRSAGKPPKAPVSMKWSRYGTRRRRGSSGRADRRFPAVGRTRKERKRRRVTLPANAKRHPSAERFSLARATAPPTGKRRLTRSI